MPRPYATLLMLAGALLLTACGGGGTTFENTSGDGTTSGGLVTQLAVVAADLDLDGASDVLEIPLGTDGRVPTEVPRCWRGSTDGLRPVADWSEHPLLEAIRRDLLGRSEQDILDDEGAHQALLPSGAGTVPYAVLHLEAAGAATDVGPGVPTIDALHPDSAHAGALVGLRGTGLAARDEETTVTFDGIDAEVLLALPRFALAVVPAGTNLGDVDVVLTRGTQASDAATFEVVARPTPVVTAVRPEPVVVGILAVVTGEHLGTPADEVTVTFGGVQAERVLPLGRRLFVRVPAGAVSGDLVVTVAGTAGVGFPVDVATGLDTPTLTSVTPSSASPGSLVEIEGEDLFVIGQRPAVSFGTAQATVFGRTRDGIVAIVPTGADGDVTVALGGRTSSGLAFTPLERGDPRITAISPAAAAPGELVTIEGADLYDLGGLFGSMGPGAMPLRMPVVHFGTQRAFFSFPVPGGLRVRVPFGATAGATTVDVEIGGVMSNAVAFTVN